MTKHTNAQHIHLERYDVIDISLMANTRRYWKLMYDFLWLFRATIENGEKVYAIYVVFSQSNRRQNPAARYGMRYAGCVPYASIEKWLEKWTEIILRNNLWRVCSQIVFMAIIIVLILSNHEIGTESVWHKHRHDSTWARRSHDDFFLCHIDYIEFK